MSVLSFMATNNITGVRGNHDQKVVEWRSWLDWIRSMEEGPEWLDAMHRNWLVAQSQGVELEAWIEHEKKVDKTAWWQKVPNNWKLFGEHYRIAHDMSNSEFEYLLALPLTLHIPSAHTFIAHGGLLSSDPSHSSTHPRQPLSHVPILPSVNRPNDTTAALRRLQEMAILNDVPQNTDPWVVLNMRSILKDNTVTR
jgi:hypothetical protein